MKNIIMYTDGSCLGNPGLGGYGVILTYGQHTKEFSGGFKLTTNNRMELLACIVGLEALKEKCSVIIYSDSKYVVDSISKGWVEKWQKNNWKRNKKDKAENIDLWLRFLNINSKHITSFKWVKGHAGHPENERCDDLARNATQNKNLATDTGYKP